MTAATLLTARTKPLTGPQIVLLAALDLERVDHEWTPQQLAVASWNRSPRTFGLEGFWDKYPDSKRVECILYAKYSPLRQGEDRTMIRKVRPGVYALTEFGREEARRLLAKEAVHD